jgi:lysophospholipase L1-like esterase
MTLATNTLRQFVRTSIGGKQLRVRFSNAYGTSPVEIRAVHVALSAGKGSSGEGTIEPSTDKVLMFQGATPISIPAGGEVVSDPTEYEVPALGNLAVSIYFGEVSATTVTGHPGSRTTSFVTASNGVFLATMKGGMRTAHWYVLSGIDVLAEDASKAVVILGDSITDGRGSTTDGNDRWPDVLAWRLKTNGPTPGVAVVNMGIGGNGIFGGLGPSAVSRFEHDVSGQPGAGWLVLFEGVNDIGGSRSPAIGTNLIAAFGQFATKAHEKNIRVYGATITPFGGSGYYSAAHEEARQTVNSWIRTNGLYDAVIDFDALVQDPLAPSKLLRSYDTGDHLHLNPAGYKAMADGIDLKLFTH